MEAISVKRQRKLRMKKKKYKKFMKRTRNLRRKLDPDTMSARKQVDPRIGALIRNGLQEKKRSFFVVVGDHSKDVIVRLHYIMSRVDIKQNKSVLWAYKNKLLNFTSHRKKREAKIKKEIKKGIREVNDEDPFELTLRP
ncbi:hypothetical protein NLG97_g11315 [Lecanicillium saksenae]|uniref:Uncharacterized protein n=1 Tax=Lecanicillium saksenae TaxID=468837 RepID=A0ACC1QAS1_9HYPO|nr:hypothetical protein NLG97_g11315 [Lecanicillium saksenae]